MQQTLIEILDSFGREHIHAGDFPHLPTKRQPYDNNRNHRIDLYAHRGVYVIVVDGTIEEISGIAKNGSETYKRTGQAVADHIHDVVIDISDPLDHFLMGFEHLYSFTNRFVYDRSYNMHFDGIGHRLEQAGQL